MPSPKSGKAGNLVAPQAPKEAQDADKADPGEMAQIKAEQQQKQQGKYGSTPVNPHRAPQTDEEKEKKKSWIEAKLVDEEDQPIPGALCRIVLPDKTVAELSTNEKGIARVDGFEPGTCKISFPDLDKDAWEPA